MTEKWIWPLCSDTQRWMGGHDLEKSVRSDKIGPKLTEIGPVFDFQGVTMRAVVKKRPKVYQNFTQFYRILIF